MSRKRKIKFVGEKQNNKLAYLFIAPWLIGLLVFTLIPMCMTFVYSFGNVKNTINGFEFELKGFEHYTTAFLGNLDFTEALLGFLAMEVTYVPIIIIISFIIALVLTKGIKGKTIFRVIFFLPVIIISGSLISRIFPEPIVTEAGTII
jgi:ABC-type sugar transport system permease subunit